MLKDFYDCERELLNYHLEEEIFSPRNSFKNLTFDTFHEVKSNPNIHGIELIVRPECNQNCEYCYIARHGKDLYPLEERASREQILNNLQILLDYIFNEREIYIRHFELFAGDLFYDDLFFDVLDVFYKILKPKKDIYPAIFANNQGLILTPCNFSFIDNDEQVQRFEEYVARFRKELNWDIGMSVSTDGKYATDTREGYEVPDEHFQKLFEFTLRHPRVGFHPILSASNIEHAIKNYDWWKEQYAHYYKDDATKDFLPYWLEARNDDWDENSIAKFIELLDHMIVSRFEMCENDIDKFAYHLLCGDGKHGTLRKMHHGDLLNIRPLSDRSAEASPCSLSGLACITLNNLSFVPCHRLTYKQFRGGSFEVKDGKIVGVIPYNPGALLNITMMPIDSAPMCVNCVFKPVCHKGCCGAQFEASGEVFQPCLSVCQLLREMFGFMIAKFEDMGVFDSAKKQGIVSSHMLDTYYTIARYYGDMVRERDNFGKEFA